MVPKKPQSKRVRLAHKNRILKRVKDHHRKERRYAKKNPSKFNKAKKDPGIPNEWPFKEEMLNEIQQQKIWAEEEKDKLKLAAQAARAKAKKAAKKEETLANIEAARAAARAKKAAGAETTDKKKAKKSKD